MRAWLRRRRKPRLIITEDRCYSYSHRTGVMLEYDLRDLKRPPVRWL